MKGHIKKRARMVERTVFKRPQKRTKGKAVSSKKTDEFVEAQREKKKNEEKVRKKAKG